MKPPSIFLFAGELSGDIHGEKLVAALRANHPRARVYGVGGPRMRSSGLECILPMEKFQVMGFIDVFIALPKLIRHFLYLRNLLLKEQPDIVLLIDYPGFNLALAKSLFKRSFKGKVCQYICPSVWAWGKRRIKKMEKILDHLFVTFPFEQKLFNPEKLQVDYVGHPLTRQQNQVGISPLDVDEETRIIGIFPGSRQKELIRNFPLQLKVIQRLLQDFPDLFFVVSVSQPAFSLQLDDIMRKEGFHSKNRIMFVESSQNTALMKRCSLAIAKSGTNNLELALSGVPTIVTYGIGPLDLFIAKNILRIRLPHYCIVNILADKRIFPELIGPHFTEDELYAQATQFLSSKRVMEECREKCDEIGIILGNKDPEQEIANKIKILLNDKKERPLSDLHRSS